MSKKVSKYIVAFDYTDKTLIVLSSTSGGISIISFTGIIRVPVGITSASFTLDFFFFFDYRNNEEIIKNNKK